MIKTIVFTIIFCFFNSLTIYGQHIEHKTLENYLRSSIPEKLKAINLGISKKNDVVKTLGKPLKENKSHQFYKLSHKEYDTTIGYKNKTVEYIIYQYKPDSIYFKDIKQWVSQEQIDQAIYQQDEKQHDSGRSIEIDLPSKGIRLIISRNKSRRIKSVTFFNTK